MPLLDTMIRAGRFNEFVQEIIRIKNDENEEKTLWEFWLHRVFDMTYEEFLNSIQTNEAPNNQPSSRAELESTVHHSAEMLNEFRL